MTDLPSGTLTFLFTDIEGSTRLWEEDPEQARLAMARHDRLIEQLVSEHHGSVVRPRGEGDSRFAVFREASAAVTAACAIQRAFLIEPWPTAEPLPLRVVFSYSSWDRFVVAMHPRTGLKSLAEVKERRYPLRLSVREDLTHSTRVCTDQLLVAYGFSVAELESWGGSLQTNGGPGDKRRLNASREGPVECVIGEGIVMWLPVALEHGFELLTLEDEVFSKMTALGWRRVILPKGYTPRIKADHECIDYSGWPLYTRASLPDDDVYKVCEALAARSDEVPWEDSFESVAKLGQDAEATPLDVPLHPGAAKWFREQR